MSGLSASLSAQITTSEEADSALQDSLTAVEVSERSELSFPILQSIFALGKGNYPGIRSSCPNFC